MNLDNWTTDRQPYADAIGLRGIDPLERVVEILDARQDGPRIGSRCNAASLCASAVALWRS